MIRIIIPIRIHIVSCFFVWNSFRDLGIVAVAHPCRLGRHCSYPLVCNVVPLVRSLRSTWFNVSPCARFSGFACFLRVLVTIVEVKIECLSRTTNCTGSLRIWKETANLRMRKLKYDVLVISFGWFTFSSSLVRIIPPVCRAYTAASAFDSCIVAGRALLLKR